MKVLETQPITASDIRQYLLCPCALYLEHHGPTEERAAAHAFLEHLREVGLEHELSVLAEHPHVTVPDGTMEERAESTLQLLRKGVDRIYHPVLLAEDLVGIPDFLERTEVPSDLGDFSYRPVDIKISTSPKPEHAVQLGFYSLLLESVHGVMLPTADVILVDRTRATIEMASAVESAREMIAEAREVLAGRRETPTLSSECGMCPWNDYCLKAMSASADISLIDGLGKAKKAPLNALGYVDLKDIANAASDALSQVKGIGQRMAERIVRQASVLLDGRPKMISRPRFPDAEIELYLDMECQQQTQVIYLIGVLESRPDGEKFRAFVAERPEDEGEMWDELLAYLQGLPRDPVIYHYHSFESTHLRKLAERHGLRPDVEPKLFDNLIDLHRVLKDSVVLPIHSYGLKTVAKWLGFRWTETEADAAMSMLWFDLWLKTGNRDYLEWSIEYNEDDCRATKVVKEWVASVARHV